MNPERLIYTFVSTASDIDASWGKGVPAEGVDRLARLAHRHGIPVTWIVNRGSVAVLADRINEWHERFGDNVMVRCPPRPGIPDKKAAALRWKEAFGQEWAAVAEAFPWATAKIAATGYISSELIELLEDIGFDGIWGYCWEQTWWDNIAHKGVPWGFWYVDRKRYKAPHPTGGRIVGCEWTARDLRHAYHTASPVVYSSDPDDVRRAGLCSATDITYWKAMFQDYLANTACNDQVYFLQHQEAHEMEHSDGFKVASPDEIAASSAMLDRFFGHVRACGATCSSLPEAIARYKRANAHTAPVYMLTERGEARPAMNGYTLALGGVAAADWPRTFFYYDKHCQLVFREGDSRPARLTNYVGKQDMNGDFTEDAPPVFVRHYEKTEARISLEFHIGLWPPVPFGLAYWDSLEGFAATGHEGVESAVIVQNKLVFLRLDLTGEEKTVRLTLERSVGSRT